MLAVRIARSGSAAWAGFRGCCTVTVTQEGIAVATASVALASRAHGQAVQGMREAAAAATQTTLAALGPSRPANFLLALTAWPHPEGVEAAAEAMKDTAANSASCGGTNQAAGTNPCLGLITEEAARGSSPCLPPVHALLGCSALPWVQPGPGEASSVRVAAAHLPHHQLHAFYSLDGSLPQLADLAQALTVRPPQFLLLAAGEEGGGGPARQRPACPRIPAPHQS
ncbi:hypothetical protein V8C86DRAFT_52390 [Haematococcus lacustris]